MKVLVIEPHPQSGGGSEAVAWSLCAALRARGHQMFLAYCTTGDLLPDYMKVTQNVFRVELCSFGWRRMDRTWVCIRNIISLVRANGVDAVFTSHLGYLRILALIRGLYGIPSVCHLGLPWNMSGWSTRAALRLIAGGVAPSEWVATTWRAAGWNPGRLSVIPNWVDGEKFAPCRDRRILRKQLDLPEACPMIVYAGRLVREKGIEVLLRAFGKVVQETPDAKLVLVGGGTERYLDALNWLRESLHLLPQQIIVVGTTNKPELFLAAADIVAVPSIWKEPFGLVALEGMACGALTLVGSAGELPRLMGAANEDLVVPSADVDEWAKALCFWLRHGDERLRRGLELRKHALAAFAGDASIAAYERMFLSALR